MTSVFVPPPDCWDYWGGCEPSALDTALRLVAAVFGYGPDEIFVFLLGLVGVPVVMVLLVSPLPETLREVAIRTAISIVAVGLLGHGGNLLQSLSISTETKTQAFLGLFVAMALVVVGMMGVRLSKLIRNLRAT